MEVEEITARCNNVIERGVPFPKMWESAFRSLSLNEIAKLSAKKVAVQESCLSDVCCHVLGQAKPVNALCEGASLQTGKLVALQCDGERVVHILCAQLY